MRKFLILASVLLIIQHSSAQEASTSFLVNTQQSDYLENLEELSALNQKWKLDFSRYVAQSDENYLSDFQVFSPIDSRFMAYPSQDLTKHSELMLGNYSIQSMHIGNLQMSTIYIFDVTGRMVDYQTNFSLWKSKK